MRPKHYFFLFIFYALFNIVSYASSDVKIVLDDFLTKEADTVGARDLVKAGDKLFKKGFEKYPEALAFFKGALIANDNYDPLNYKIGLCYLHSNNKRAALPFIEKCDPAVSYDYYFVLGRALHFNLKFNEAQKAYTTYYNSLKPSKQKEISEDITKLIRNCQNGMELIADSLWADVTPYEVLNSTKDDYHPFFAFVDSTLFFSSNRTKHRKLNENIYFVKKDQMELGSDTVLEVLEPGKGIGSKAHIVALSYNQAMDALLTYNGKSGKGDLFLTQRNKKGKLKTPKPLPKQINSKFKEGTAVFLDIKTIIFSSNRDGGIGGMDLYYTRLDSKNKWSQPENLGSQINTIFDEEVCGASPDGRTLYFTTEGWNSMGGIDVFATTLSPGGAWSKPVNLGYPVNTPDNDLSYLPLDTNTAIVVGSRPEGAGGLDIFKLTFKYPEIIDDNHFSVKGKVIDNKTYEPIVNAEVSIYNVFTDSVMGKEITDESGFFYKWFPQKESVGFRVKADGYNPFLKIFESELGDDTLYFVSLELTPKEVIVEKVETYDFNLVGQVKDKQSGNPLSAVLLIYDEANNLVDSVVSNVEDGRYKTSLDDIRTSYYFKVMANKYQQMDELLVFTLKDSMKTVVRNFALMPEPEEESLMFAGTVSDANTGDPVIAEMKFIDPVTQNETVIYPDSITGRYTFMLQSHHSMVVELRKEGYFFAFEMVPAPQSKSEKLVKKDFQLKAIKKGEKIVLNNILFETGKAILTKASYAELDKLVRVMLNSDVNVEISGHTDNTGGYQLNKDLSLKRAKSVVDYLISSGVETNRLSYQGYGPDQPVTTNDTKEGRAKNRRVEMKIVE